MPQELKTDATRVKRCQSTVYLWPRRRPGTEDVLEFLADSDADIVRGELALLQRLFSGSGRTTCWPSTCKASSRASAWTRT
jgi:cysteine desulfurase/selenocysteine lyase